MAVKPGASPLVTAGDPEFHLWCAACQDSARVRVPLAVNGTPAGGIEFCPGCGTGHDRPGVCLVPQDPAIPGASSPPPGAPGPLLPRIARAVHARACRRAGTMALECALGDCPWPGLHRLTVTMDGEDGTWRYVFCRAAHRKAWSAQNGITGL